jgi:hypothetical protein
MAKTKSMHKTAMVGKKHGSPMSKGGAHQVAPMAKKTRGDRKGTKGGGGKMTAM